MFGTRPTWPACRRLAATFLVGLLAVEGLVFLPGAQTAGAHASSATAANNTTSTSAYIPTPTNEALKTAAETDGGPILNGATIKAQVQFFDRDGNQLQADSSLTAEQQAAENQGYNQTLVSGDKIIEPPVPPTIDNYVFDHWALNDGSEGWQSKVYDFNTVQTFSTTSTIKLYAQYRRSYVIGFIVRKEDIGGDQDRIVGSFAETRTCDENGNYINDSDEVSDRLSCRFEDYEKDIRPFLGGGKYVAGWTRARDSYNDEDFVQDSEIVGAHQNFYATIREGFALVFDSTGGSQVPVSYGSPRQAPTQPSSTPTKAGYTFKGWSSDPTTYTPYDFEKPLTEDTKAYAFWDPAITTVRLETLVESSVNTNEDALPLVWNAFRFTDADKVTSCRADGNCKETNPLIIFDSSQKDGLPEAGATDGTEDYTQALARTTAAAAARSGEYRLQASVAIPGVFKSEEHVGLDSALELKDKCVVPSGMEQVFEASLEEPADDSYATQGVAADGSTTFICRLKRKRGSFTYYYSYLGSGNLKSELDGKSDNVLYAVTFYGLLDGDDVIGSSGEYPGENLTAATNKAQELAKEYLLDQDKYLESALITTRNASIYDAAGASATKYAAPPSYSSKASPISFTIPSSIRTQIFYPRIEIGSDYLLSKGTNSFASTSLDSDLTANYEANKETYLAELKANRDEIFDGSSHISIDPLLGYNSALGEVSLIATAQDHNAEYGFRQFYYGNGEYAAEGAKTIGFKKYDPDNPPATVLAFLNRLDTEVADYLRTRQPKKTSGRTNDNLRIVPLYYKRQAYCLNLIADDDTEDYKVMVPYNYSLTEAANANYTSGDDDAQLEKAKGLQAYLDKYVPGVTRRSSDGAVFIGWSQSNSQADLVTSASITGDTFKMPAFDSSLIALWRPVHYTLRVFCNVSSTTPCLTNDYAVNSYVNESDFKDQTLTPPAGLQLNDLQGWMWRPRYVATYGSNGQPLTYRYGSWRDLEEGATPQMFSDIDMRPRWSLEALQVTYYPGQVDESGTATGPQGTGSATSDWRYQRGSYPVAKDSAFTAPVGYWFAGWSDQDGNLIYPNDLVVGRDDQGKPTDQGILTDRQLYARWLAIPTTKVTYHSNYPAELGAADQTEVAQDGCERNTTHQVLDVNAAWSRAAARQGWSFIGWSDTADGEVKYLPTSLNGTSSSRIWVNSVVLNDRHVNDLYARWEQLPLFYIKKVTAQVGGESDPALDPDGDPSFQLLSGAKFALYKEDILESNKLQTPVLAVETQELAGERWVDSAQFMFTLPDGHYFLVESQSPTGYELLTTPIEFTISNGTLTLTEEQALVTLRTATIRHLPDEDESSTNTDAVALSGSASLRASSEAASSSAASGSVDYSSAADTSAAPGTNLAVGASASPGSSAQMLVIENVPSRSLPASGAPGYLVFLLVGLAGLVIGFGFKYFDHSKK